MSWGQGIYCVRCNYGSCSTWDITRCTCMAMHGASQTFQARVPLLLFCDKQNIYPINKRRSIYLTVDVGAAARAWYYVMYSLFSHCRVAWLLQHLVPCTISTEYLYIAKVNIYILVHFSVAQRVRCSLMKYIWYTNVFGLLYKVNDLDWGSYII